MHFLSHNHVSFSFSNTFILVYHVKVNPYFLLFNYLFNQRSFYFNQIHVMNDKMSVSLIVFQTFLKIELTQACMSAKIKQKTSQATMSRTTSMLAERQEVSKASS